MKTLKTYNTCIILLLICLGSLHAVTINSNYQGWVQSTGSSNGASSGNNTFTGIESNAYFNSWANFDLSGITGVITSVKIEMFTTLWNSTGTYKIDIYDVSTSFSGLNTGSAGVAVYNDLRSGNLYGSGMFTQNTSLTITLSAQAIADVNASLGSTFRVGFTNATLNGQSVSGVDIGVYTNGGGSGGYPRLVLETTPVPEVGTISLLVVGFAIMLRKNFKK